MLAKILYTHIIKPSQEYFKSTLRGGGGDVEEKGKRNECMASFQFPCQACDNLSLGLGWGIMGV